MTIHFLSNPGCQERHLRRRIANPLFATERQRIDQQMVDEARRLDQIHESEMIERFSELVEEASRLEGEESHQRIAELKQNLDQLVVECALFGDRHQIIIDSIEQLVASMIRALRSIAGDNAKLLDLLGGEERARRTQYELLRYPLVADLIYMGTPIERDELVATLLSESDEAIRAALWLFSPEQLDQIRSEARALVDQINSPALLRETTHKLTLMERLE